MERPDADRRVQANGRAARRARHAAIRELVASERVGSQHELAALLGQRGFDVTQATVSRDIAELGLVKIVRGERHIYAAPEQLTSPAHDDDAMLRRVLGDVRIEVRRSGLILLLISTPGTASIIAEAIDRSRFTEQVGTLAGDNTVLVLFGDEPALERWRDRLVQLQAAAAPSFAAQGGQR